MTRIIRFFLLFSLVLVIAVGGSVGCSGSKKGSANVSGKVTYKGEVVPGGNVAFHRTQEDAVGQLGGSLKGDGTYSAVGLPTEEYIVTVETESLNVAKPPPYKSKTGQGQLDAEDPYMKKMKEEGKGPSTQPQGTYKKIPSKYSDKKTSPLRTTLTRGDNTYNVELTDE